MALSLIEKIDFVLIIGIIIALLVLLIMGIMNEQQRTKEAETSAPV